MERSVMDLLRFVAVSRCFDHLSHLRAAKFNSKIRQIKSNQFPCFPSLRGKKKNGSWGHERWLQTKNRHCKANFSLVFFGKQCLWCLGSASPALCLIP